MTTPDGAAAFAAYAATIHERAARLSRESAILALYGGFQMQRADVPTLDSLSEVACPTADLAALIEMAIREGRKGLKA